MHLLVGDAADGRGSVASAAAPPTSSSSPTIPLLLHATTNRKPHLPKSTSRCSITSGFRQRTLVAASISAERCFAEPWLEALSQARASGATELRGAMAGTMRQARASNAVARDAHLLRDATRRDAGHVHHERDEGARRRRAPRPAPDEREAGGDGELCAPSCRPVQGSLACAPQVRRRSAPPPPASERRPEAAAVSSPGLPRGVVRHRGVAGR
jgi:hypothetical protein